MWITNLMRTVLLLGAMGLLFSPKAPAQIDSEAFPMPQDLADSGDTDRGASGTEPFVDSVMIDGRVIRLTVRLSDEVKRDTARLRALLDSLDRSDSAVIAANLDFDPEEWQPTPADRARREEAMAIAQDRDWIYPQDVARLGGVSVPLKSIGQSLGLTEDVSPKVSYTLKRTRHVSIKIYTQSALPVCTMVDTTQRPASYEVTWDFTDKNGRRVLAGSYFAEVIADGEELLLRKRIVAP